MALSTMNSTPFSRYLSDPKVRATLRKKPGQEGFSLIELVVVIAVLAILAAVALPNFLGVQKDGQVAAAKNTLATMVKECVTSGLRGGGEKWSSTKANQGKLNGYEMASLIGDSCYGGTASGSGLINYNIVYSSTTGETVKTCSFVSGDYAAGCFTNSSLTTTVTTKSSSGNGSW